MPFGGPARHGRLLPAARSVVADLGAGRCRVRVCQWGRGRRLLEVEVDLDVVLNAMRVVRFIDPSGLLDRRDVWPLSAGRVRRLCVHAITSNASAA